MIISVERIYRILDIGDFGDRYYGTVDGGVR